MFWLFTIIASTLSLFFALILTSKYREKRRLHNLLYAISLYMYSIASFIEFYHAAFGMFLIMYKVYYFFAIALVPVMAAATLYVRANRIVGHLFLGYVLILSSIFLIMLIITEVNEGFLLQSDVTVGGQALPTDVRKFSFWLSGIGGMVLIAAAIWSWWKSFLVGNLHIATAAVIMSIGGTLSKYGLTFILPIKELIGIILLFYGVVSLEKGKKLRIDHLKLGRISIHREELAYIKHRVAKIFNFARIPKLRRLRRGYDETFDNQRFENE